MHLRFECSGVYWGEAQETIKKGLKKAELGRASRTVLKKSAQTLLRGVK